MIYLAVIPGAFAFGILLLLGSRSTGGSLALLRVNFRGRSLPTGAGALLFPGFLFAYVIGRLLEGDLAPELRCHRDALLILVVGMGFLGFIDDILGDAEDKGFRGHIGALASGRITTGMMKAGGGLLVSAAASALFSDGPADLLLNACLIALAANTLNLLDTRPGRALKVFFPAIAGVLVLNQGAGEGFLPYMMALGALAAVLMPGDLAERYMLGDAGSNVLGAAVGLGIAVGAGRWWRLGTAVLLLSANLLSERYSFTGVIERNRVLAALDRLGRKGENSGWAK